VIIFTRIKSLIRHKIAHIIQGILHRSRLRWWAQILRQSLRWRCPATSSNLPQKLSFKNTGSQLNHSSSPRLVFIRSLGRIARPLTLTILYIRGGILKCKTVNKWNMGEWILKTPCNFPKLMIQFWAILMNSCVIPIAEILFAMQPLARLRRGLTWLQTTSTHRILLQARVEMLSLIGNTFL